MVGGGPHPELHVSNVQHPARSRKHKEAKITAAQVQGCPRQGGGGHGAVIYCLSPLLIPPAFHLALVGSPHPITRPPPQVMRMRSSPTFRPSRQIPTPTISVSRLGDKSMVPN